jgi:hypothetical protein
MNDNKTGKRRIQGIVKEANYEREGIGGRGYGLPNPVLDSARV